MPSKKRGLHTWKVAIPLEPLPRLPKGSDENVNAP